MISLRGLPPWARRYLPTVLALLVALVSSWEYLGDQGERVATSSHGTILRELIEQRRSGVWVETTAPPLRLLKDDLDGDRHQRFLLEAGAGKTVLVAHNIDLAPRVPLQKGDVIRLRGRYEWNEKGGVIHWTHHDPTGRKPGGWIELEGQKYR